MVDVGDDGDIAQIFDGHGIDSERRTGRRAGFLRSESIDYTDLCDNLPVSVNARFSRTSGRRTALDQVAQAARHLSETTFESFCVMHASFGLIDKPRAPTHDALTLMHEPSTVKDDAQTLMHEAQTLMHEASDIHA